MIRSSLAKRGDPRSAKSACNKRQTDGIDGLWGQRDYGWSCRGGAQLNTFEFLNQTQFDDISESVSQFAKLCLLDLIGVMAAGSRTKLAGLISNHAAEQFCAGSNGATICFDGRFVSPAGAALANGMMTDSVDAHDGYKPAKGHIGCHVLPALLAFHEANGGCTGKEFLADIVVGYEFGGRAATALHASVPDYHTSGAWGAVTAAALGTRILKLDHQTFRHAIGIGEYHGPRSQMMRCIDHPTMLKDGSGWGAMAGVSAAYLAQSGFTGAPAISVEGSDVSSIWSTFGKHWLILEQYFKPYPVCRWAQPATEAALSIQREFEINHESVDHIEVYTFKEGCNLATRSPVNTEQAQYSLPFPVAAALVFGKIGPQEVDGEHLVDERVLRLSRTMKLIEHQEYNDVFPQERFAHVSVFLKDGTEHRSERHRAEGDPETPLSESVIKAKFDDYAGKAVGKDRASKIRDIVENLDRAESIQPLLELLHDPA